MWTFGATASALLALSWARERGRGAPTSSSGACSWRAAAAAVRCAHGRERTVVSQSTLLDLVIKPWRVGA